MLENGARSSKSVPRAPKMVPSGPKMTPQLSPKSYKYHRNMILTPSGTVAVLGAHATVDIYKEYYLYIPYVILCGRAYGQHNM